ncbi:retention module-containing protein, partial [Modicisalibacter xianhensis]|uniref:retention module-containing protein n=1 Tax=Modicisalibacter xianhensis TaxID=442341 RepID=UPI00141704FC
MSTPIATVLSVSGQAWARDAEGNLRPLEPGDVLLEGEELVTGENGRVRLDFAEAEPVIIGPEQTVAMLADLDAQADVPTDEAAVLDDDLEALLSAIDEGEGDLLDVLEATAAGLGGGAGGEDGGHSFVQLARILLSTDSPSYAYEPVALDETETALFVGEESLVAAEAASTEQEPVVGSVTLSTTPNVVEGSAITVTASVDVAPTGSPLVLTLSNGQQIVIAVGETSGSVTFDSRVDDAYAQGDQPLNLSITGTQGGGYEALDTTSTATVTTVDDSDATTITLDAPQQVTEGGQITVTARVDNAPATDLTITLSNGEQIVIAANATEGGVTFASRGDDVFQQGEQSQTLSITGTEGGNYEALDTTSTATVTTVDDSDATTITLDAPQQVTEGGQITVTARVDNAPATDLTITLSNGEQIVIAANATEGGVTFASRGDDVFQQGEQSQTLSITGTEGGNYEALDTT